jgi:hypothetical protein
LQFSEQAAFEFGSRARFVLYTSHRSAGTRRPGEQIRGHAQRIGRRIRIAKGTGILSTHMYALIMVSVILIFRSLKKR